MIDLLDIIILIWIFIAVGFLLITIARKAELHIGYLAAINNKEENDLNGLYKMMKESDTMINPLHLLFVLMSVFWSSSKEKKIPRARYLRREVHKQLRWFYLTLVFMYVGGWIMSFWP